MTEVSSTEESSKRTSNINKDNNSDGKSKDGSSEEKKSEEVGNGASSSSNKNSNKNSEVTRVWPLVDIKEPHDNDVLYGRGGGTNHHDGNKRYRQMVEERKVDYVNSKRLDKPLVALDIIRNWRAQDPPGRFLKMDESTGLWHDVGDRKAREKTSQALREKAPQLRQQQREEEKEEQKKKDNNLHSSSLKKRIQNQPSSKIQRSPLVRKHTLGVDYLDPDDDPVTVDGFTWNHPLTEPVSSSNNNNTVTATAVSSRSSRFYNMNAAPDGPSSQYPSSTMREGWGDSAYALRGSGTSVNNNNMNNNVSMSPPPPRDNYEAADAGRREHSFTNNPLREASISGPAIDPWIDEREKDMTEFERQMHQTQKDYEVHHHLSKENSNNFASPPRVGTHNNKQPVGSYDYEKLAGIVGGEGEVNHHHHHYNSNNHHSSLYNEYSKRDRAPRYHPEHTGDYNPPPASTNHHPQNSKYVDTFETLEGHRHHMSNNDNNNKRGMKNRRQSPDQNYRQEFHNITSSTTKQHDQDNNSLPSSLSRPPIVKRETSHQNENIETKRAVKRGTFRDYGDEIKKLETTMGKSTLNTPGGIHKRNTKTSDSKRGQYIMEKPKSLTATDRMSTVEAIQIEFTTGISPDEVQQVSTPPKVERESSIDLIVKDVEKYLEKRTQPSKPDPFAMNRKCTEDTIGTFALDPLKDAPRWSPKKFPDRPDPFSMKNRLRTEDTLGSVDLVDSLDALNTTKFSCSSRESTIGSIDIDMVVDNSSPDKRFG